MKRAELEFCRVVGYCILFKDSDDIENYILKNNQKEQMIFLTNKIAEKMNMPKSKIQENRNKIIEFIFNNFKENGYVFHAANSISANQKMANGLGKNISNEKHKKELILIESIYRKYEPNNPYSPIGHAATDIIKNKNGWFFDGFPIHSLNYANSPQWFAYLCGKSYVYFEHIPENKRNAYANRNYRDALDAILWLIKKEKMDVQDAKVILGFFKKTWNEYEKATPCLIFVPVNQVGVNNEIKINQYLNDEGLILLLKDVTEGKVNPGKNYCSNNLILPEQLSYIDLAQLIPRNNSQKNEKIAKKQNEKFLEER